MNSIILNDEKLLTEINVIGKDFRLPGTAVSYEIISNGIINSTYKVNYFTDDKKTKSYIFQKINIFVFKKPEEIMHNIDLVTSHIRAKNPNRVTLHYHHTREGKNYSIDNENFWRVINYVDSETYNTCEDLEIIKKTGEAFGEFQMQLSDFDSASLYETIPDFHNTTKRLNTLFDHVDVDEYNRVKEAAAEIDYIKSIRDRASELSDKYNSGAFPVRVTHNDTKLNNVLFNKKTKEPLIVIDLDTVMPGMAMYDFADAVRYICNTSEEDELDLSKVKFDKVKFKAFSEGFISKVKESWTLEEIDALVLASFSITVEQAARFLDDYLTGDKYYKTYYDGHNLVRTRCQLKLAQSILEQYEELKKILMHIMKN